MPPDLKYPTPQAFLDAIRPYAQSVQQETGIPWPFIAAQAAHESRNGNSRLVVEANNLFGMTGESWQAAGKPVYVIATQEYDRNGHAYMTERPFRRYASYAECLEDWAALMQRPRYAAALTAARAEDFPGFARALQAGGYASDPQYAMRLCRVYNELEPLA